jgi:hypothetical protein
VIALIITPEGFPLAYEVLAGNTADNTTLREFLARIERQYGKARRIWLCDRGIPTEEMLQEMRASDPPVQYLVGTPKGRLTGLERALLEKPWVKAREDVRVKLLAQDREPYVFAESRERIAKERGMRRRQLKWLWRRLKQLSTMQNISRESLLMKLGAARNQAPAAWRLVTVELAVQGASFGFRLNRKKLRASTRGSLSATDQSHRVRSRQTLGVLFAVGGGRRGVQNTQRRFVDPANLSSKRAAY